MASAQPVTDSGLAQLADGEAWSLHDRLKDRYPANTPVTFALYQPVSASGPRLVDVGPRPEGTTTSELVCQLAFTGESGSFLEDQDAPIRTSPLPRIITKQTVTSYLKNPPGIRAVQVALERSRYRVEIPDWPEAMPLPVGAKIHHLGLMPERLSLGQGVQRYPITGLVYTMSNRGTDGAELKRLRWPLIFYALQAGDLAMENRLRKLLGEHRYGQASGASEYDGAEFRRTVATLLLLHHWFYPFDPVAAEMLLKMSRPEGMDLPSVFGRNAGISPPAAIPLNQDRAPAQAFQQTCADILQLLRFASYYANCSPVENKVAIEAIATMVMLICGELFVVRSHSSDAVPVRKYSDIPSGSSNSYLTVAAPWAGDYDVWLPAWKCSQYERISRTTPMPAACRDAPLRLAPGESEPNSTHAYTEPDACVTRFRAVGNGWRADLAQRARFNNDWLSDYARSRIYALSSLLQQEGPPGKEVPCI